MQCAPLFMCHAFGYKEAGVKMAEGGWEMCFRTKLYDYRVDRGCTDFFFEGEHKRLSFISVSWLIKRGSPAKWLLTFNSHFCVSLIFCLMSFSDIVNVLFCFCYYIFPQYSRHTLASEDEVF